MTFLILSNYLFGQLDYGNEEAQSILTRSTELTINTAKSWERLWEISVNPTEPLWQALTLYGAFIAALSLIYLLIRESNNKTLELTRVIEMMRFPFAITILLAGNGFILANLIKTLRAISQYWLTKILEMTFAGISITEALQKIQNTSMANSRAKEIFSECVSKTGAELTACLNDPSKIEQARQLAESFSGNTAPLQGNLISQIASGVVSTLDSAINSPFVLLFEFILSALQWCFVNGIEACLLLSGLFSPIALGLSMIPTQTPNILKWLSGYISLMLMPLGYVIIVGFTANVIALTEQAGQPLGSASMDTAFLLFISIIAPFIAIAISKGVGDGIFDAISLGAKTGIGIAGSAVSGGSTIIAKEIAARQAAKIAATAAK